MKSRVRAQAKGPSNYLLKLAREVLSDQGSRDRFTETVHRGSGAVPALVWLREENRRVSFSDSKRSTWQPDFVDVVRSGSQPGKDPLHADGAFYCLDLSSVFCVVPLTLIQFETEINVLDLCAAPGGKAIFTWRALNPTFLLCNEAIRKRTAQIISNLQRCHVHPSAVSSLDSAVISREIPNSFGLVVVDAPCSGQSLLARAEPSPGCFYPATVRMNCGRQRRILANAADLVAPGGWLLYSTCTYSLDENERNVEWFLRIRPDFVASTIPALSAHRSSLTEPPCYRLFPHEGFGSGGFCCLFQREGEYRAEALKVPREWRWVWEST